MNLSQRFVVAGLAAAALLPAAAQTSPDQIQHEAKLMLHYFGRGYASGQLWSVPPTPPSKDGKPRAVKLASGELSVIGSSQNQTLTASRLKLTRGDLNELGLTLGATPVNALTRQFGKPDTQDAHRLVYRGVSEICEDHFTFIVDKGLLQAIEWDWCHD